MASSRKKRKKGSEGGRDGGTKRRIMKGSGERDETKVATREGKDGTQQKVEFLEVVKGGKQAPHGRGDTWGGEGK